jgi:hypothetical protein
MSNTISLTPGFSPVTTGEALQNRFNGFLHAVKPLKPGFCIGNQRAIRFPQLAAIQSSESCYFYCVALGLNIFVRVFMLKTMAIAKSGLKRLTCRAHFPHPAEAGC